MADFVTLTCPSCGGKLQITPDIDRFACGHCGNEHIVKRSGGIVALAPVIKGLGQIQRGTDKTAAELGIRRLREEICHDEQEVARLVREAVETERNQVSWSLAEIGKRSQSGWDRFFNLNASDPARIETMVLALSTAEADRLVVAKYTGSKVRPILLAMVALKRDLEQKRLQLETYRRVVAE